MQSIDGGAPRAITPENVTGVLVTPDNQRVLGRSAGHYYFYPVAGGARVPVAGLQATDVPVRFSHDGTEVYVASFGKIPAILMRVNLASGERTLLRETAPPDRSGLINVGPIFVTPDGGTMAYSYLRLLSELYLVDFSR
jgi:hypothetical protein